MGGASCWNHIDHQPWATRVTNGEFDGMHRRSYQECPEIVGSWEEEERQQEVKMDVMRIESTLNEYPFYKSYRAGRIDKKRFLENMIAFQPDLEKAGLTADEFRFILGREGVSQRQYKKMYNKIKDVFSTSKFLPPE